MKTIWRFFSLLFFTFTILVSIFILGSPSSLGNDELSYLDITLNQVNHIGIPVSNLDRSIEFYQALTGGEILFINPMYGEGLSKGVNVPDANLRFAMIKADNVNLELIEYEHPRGKEFNRNNNDIGAIHVAFQVSDIQAAYKRLRSQGIEFNAEPYTFKKADGAPAVIGATFAYFKDPDGIQLEIFEANQS